MGDRSLSRRLAPSLNRLTFDADETAAGAFLVRETFTPGRAADGVRTDTALSTPPVRRGAGRLGFAVVAFGLVIENRHSKNLGHYINLPRGAQGCRSRQAAPRPSIIRRPSHLRVSQGVRTPSDRGRMPRPGRTLGEAREPTRHRARECIPDRGRPRRDRHRRRDRRSGVSRRATRDPLPPEAPSTTRGAASRRRRSGATPCLAGIDRASRAQTTGARGNQQPRSEGRRPRS